MFIACALPIWFLNTISWDGDNWLDCILTKRLLAVSSLSLCMRSLRQTRIVPFVMPQVIALITGIQSPQTPFGPSQG